MLLLRGELLVFVVLFVVPGREGALVLFVTGRLIVLLLFSFVAFVAALVTFALAFARAERGECGDCGERERGEVFGEFAREERGESGERGEGVGAWGELPVWRGGCVRETASTG